MKGNWNTNKPGVLAYIAQAGGDLVNDHKPAGVHRNTVVMAGLLLDTLGLTRYERRRARKLACSTALALHVLERLPARLFIYEPGMVLPDFAVYEVIYDPHPCPLTGCQFSRAAVVELSKAAVFVVKHLITGGVSLAFAGRLVRLREG